MWSLLSGAGRWNRYRMDSLARSLARLCLALYPSAFRQKFGPALVDTFQDQLDRAFTRGGWRGWLFCVIGECWNLLVQAVHVRRELSSGKARSEPGSDSDASPSRDLIRGAPLRNLGGDLRRTIRRLLRHPGLSLGVILILAIGIGLNAIVFSVVNSYLLRPLPFPDADRLVSIRVLPPGTPPTLFETIPRNLSELDWPVPPELAEETISWDLDAFTLLGEGSPKVLFGAWITPGYLRALGTRPEIGRILDDTDGLPGASPVALISYDFWQNHFGGDPSVLGSTISAFTSDRPDDAETFTVVGVLPGDFWFINDFTEILTNLTGSRTPYMMKVRPGVTKDEVARYLTSIVHSQVENIDPAWPGMNVYGVQEVYVRSVRPSLIVLFISAGLILLIACGNVAMLLTVQALGRRQELSIRRVLGASRLRIGKELCLEGLCLASAAGLLGLMLGYWGLSALGPLIQAQLRTTVPGGVEMLQIGGMGILVTLLVSGLTAIVFAVIPILTVTKRGLAQSLLAQSRSASDTPRQQFFRNLVVGGEIAISLILLIAASLMLQSTFYLYQKELGLDPRNVLSAGLSLRQQNYPEGHLLIDFVSRYLDGIRSTPGVVSAAVTSGRPLQDRRSGGVIREGASVDTALSAVAYVVSEGYFRTLRIPLLSGRAFDERDQSESQPVVILSESLARGLWPEQRALGRQVRLELEGPGASLRTVVGVSGDVVETLTADAIPDVYVPYKQSPVRFMTLLARIGVEPAAVTASVEETMQRIDPTGAVMNAGMLERHLVDQRRRPQFLAGLLSGFTAFAVLLAVVGLSAIVSYAVSQRKRDIAIRMALGATSRLIIRHFLVRALWVVSGGVAVGLLGSFALVQSLSSQLHGISSFDQLTFFGAVLLLYLAALPAVWFPAHRASSTDPVATLKR